MTAPFEHDGRVYHFEKSGSEYVIRRDDATIAFDTYKTHQGFHAYRPAMPTIRECQAAIRGERPSTFYHRLVFAASATEAAKIAEEEDHAKGS